MYICTFGFGIRPKARCFSGQIFGFGLKWKTYFRSFTVSLPRKNFVDWNFDENSRRFPMSSASPIGILDFNKDRGLTSNWRRRSKLAWTWCAIALAKAHEIHTVSFWNISLVCLLRNRSKKLGKLTVCWLQCLSLASMLASSWAASSCIYVLAWMINRRYFTMHLISL